MSSSSWQKQLWEILTRPAKTNRAPRLALLGVGNEFNADDAAGPLVIRDLSGRLSGQPELLCLDAGLAPENFTGALRRFEPDIILFIDAANLGEIPGTVQLVEWQSAGGLSASTHTLPLAMLAQFLIGSLPGSGNGCQVALLAIQPATLEPYTPVSAQVRQAIQNTVEELAGIIQRTRVADDSD